ncbi:MAG: hypothetical protein Tp1111DCM1126091_134 [Prokaryotic dsDNA virus sp.]|nr:MAG: hypothetical protein Tp1111DCM1126091_134 [Prokaryotic dsDNA virus sp.]|tara:strand:+ start:15982 stop:16956 length:975 start_codon:yes stop_codon:yes gene_type:complete
MNTIEFKAGQRWRVIDAEEFNVFLPDEYARVRDGDLLIAIEMEDHDDDHWKMRIVNSAAVTLACSSDIAEGCIVLSEESTEEAEDLPTEFAVGQLWYVYDDSSEGFACPYRSSEGDIIEITRSDKGTSDGWRGYNHAQDQDGIIIYNYDLNNALKYIGTVETHKHLVGRPTEASDHVSEAWATSVPEGVESVSQESTGSPQEILDAAHTCVGVSRSSVDSSEEVRMYKHGEPMVNSKDILWHIISRAETFNGHSQFTVSQMDLSTLITLTRMLDDYVTEFCEMRLSWGGDHMGYYTADIYEIASARDGAEDKILMQIEKVTGVG